MHTFAKLKTGEIMILWSENTNEETMNLIPMNQCNEFGDYDPECFTTKEYPYNAIAVIDTNLAVLQ